MKLVVGFLSKGLVKRSTGSSFLALLADNSDSRMHVKCRAPACKAQMHMNMLSKGLEANQHLEASVMSLWDGEHGVHGRFVDLLAAGKVRCSKVGF